MSNNPTSDESGGSSPSSRHIDKCEFSQRKRQITWKTEDFGELISYFWCIYLDDAKFEKCPYPARFCGVKRDFDKLAEYVERKQAGGQ